MGAQVKKQRFAEQFRIEFASMAAAGLNCLLGATYRTRLLDRPYAERRRAGEQVRCIYAVWHCTLWHTLAAMSHQEICVMVSSHRDGEIAARAANRRGFGLVRGSSTRGGARAMLDLARIAREGSSDFGMVIDGPRGPPRAIKDGVLFASSRTGLPIVPLGLWVDRAWYTRSWDRHVIGKPLCRVALALGEEIQLPADATRADMEATWMPALARGMDAAEARARAAVTGLC